MTVGVRPPVLVTSIITTRVRYVTDIVNDVTCVPRLFRHDVVPESVSLLQLQAVEKCSFLHPLLLNPRVGLVDVGWAPWVAPPPVTG